MGAIGLYCDLLMMPGVLHPEHRQYADELRLLGVRSGALIERLFQSALHHNDERQSVATGTFWEAKSSPSENPAKMDRDRCNVETLRKIEVTGNNDTLCRVDPLLGGAAVNLSSGVISSPTQPAPVSLRRIVERCAGLLSRMVGGRVIELNFGEAASIPVSVDEEAVERILVNLVRNAATALCATDRSGGYESDNITADSNLPDCMGAVLHRTPDPADDETPGAIRIGVGYIVNRASDPKPWTIRRVRLTVEDSGCGMTPQQLERILYGTRSPSRGSHGIGFRVVRELVASSGGDLRAMSAPGIGTRVQIEWPVAATTLQDAIAKPFGRTEYIPQHIPSKNLSDASSIIRQEHRELLASPDRAVSGSRADSRSIEGSITVC
jgi:hypothetical protein